MLSVGAQAFSHSMWETGRDDLWVPGQSGPLGKTQSQKKKQNPLN